VIEKCMLCSGEIGEGAHGLGVCLAEPAEPTWEQDWERDFPATAREANRDAHKSTRATLSRDAYKHGHAAGRGRSK
jgi:hypothetical protein